ncbi:hypothetical protein GCM10007416_35680 [Kroppenstedtia guangzhouensis]|uniref:Uncharacterized protein n=1 Tax=Kroppenstedtia guangzhouensis TaxID=1274356 RepID=A0ABQ1H6Q2_9BACL|nr:hypothetical protein [Kroppenstedtia guangzhouensis]GGA59489.1 hypothetical protein GCM10007416_35680 [Kroppenstedtia guangzhouensis]
MLENKLMAMLLQLLTISTLFFIVSSFQYFFVESMSVEPVADFFKGLFFSIVMMSLYGGAFTLLYGIPLSYLVDYIVRKIHPTWLRLLISFVLYVGIGFLGPILVWGYGYLERIPIALFGAFFAIVFWIIQELIRWRNRRIEAS